jgi:hypothetical protein
LSNGSCSLRPFRPIAPIALLGIIAWGSPARATELRVDGDYRIRIANNTNLQLDGQPSYLGQETWAEQRVRLTPVIAEADQIEITAQFDIFSGLFAGDTAPSFDGLGWTGRSTRNSLQATGFDFRAMYAQFNLGYGMLKFGQMPRDWGMGLLWNAGNESETVDFGDQRFGDIVERVIFTNRPFDFLGPRNPLSTHLQLLLGGDLVYRDRLASLIERNGGGLEWGDRALEFFGGLNYVDGESLRIGLVALRRIQTYVRDGGDLHDWTFDLYARTAEPLQSIDALLTLELEAAAVNGGTSHLSGLDSPGTTQILQGGFASRARLAFEQLEVELEGGYASGDANPFDSSSNGFDYNRDYKVSLVLWDEAVLFQTQNAAARLASSASGAHPPNGVDSLPTEGAVTNAVYLKPTLRYRPAALLGKVRFTAALLWARAPEPVIDAYESYLRSAPANSFGAAAGKNYGVELDGAITWRDRYFQSRLGLELGVQYGVLFPGDVFAKMDGSKMGKAVAAKLRGGVTF